MTTGPYQEQRAPSGRFLPPDPRVREPHRLTPQLALRVAILGAFALLVFVVLFFRLWSLQVLSGDEYLNAAQSNQLRLIRVEAPRGPILDRRGRVVVSNVAGTAVELWVGDMPKEGRYELVQRLSGVLDVKPRKLAREVDSRRLDPLTPIVVKTAVGEEQVDYLYEHQAEFPGVRIVQIYLRGYPYSSLAAQILGYTGEISPSELKRLRKTYRAGDRIGKAGIEAAYDSYLRGRPGLGQIRVDSLGRQVSPYVPRQESTPGYALRLTLDIRTTSGLPTAARSSRSTRVTERSSRWRRRRRSSRPSSWAGPIPRSSTRSIPIPAIRSSTVRPPVSTHPARSGSRSRLSLACRSTFSRPTTRSSAHRRRPTASTSRSSGTGTRT
jgi:hypothetical protein